MKPMLAPFHFIVSLLVLLFSFLVCMHLLFAGLVGSSVEETMVINSYTSSSGGERYHIEHGLSLASLVVLVFAFLVCLSLLFCWTCW